MSTSRIGGWVSDPAEKQNKSKRQSFWVTRSGKGAFVDSKYVHYLGFTQNQAFQANRAFVRKLYDLSKKVDSQKPYDKNDEEALKQSLKLKASDSLPLLNTLRTIGVGLRGKLSKDMVSAFNILGFLREGVKEEPAFTFQDGAEAPILWEMFYEGNQLDPLEWERFWGFRIPITHWVNESRTEEILLGHGVFSAISDKLPFAGREVELLTQKLKQINLGVSEYSLTEILKKRVNEYLLNEMHKDSEQVMAWWEARPAKGEKTDTWLISFLDQLGADPGLREYESENWKKRALADIFKDSRISYDLIHFACHCEPNQATEFLTRLEMMVAGEPISLEVGLMSDLRRKDSWNLEDPGPLVFLNACGTAQQGPSYEPPGFPVHWITCQGALAVVATLCPVPDYFAHTFALKFYEILFESVSDSRNPESARNCYVAEALLSTRRYFMETFNNPLGLAYVLYAANGAHVKVDFM
jgi:hypothetical protein